MAELHETLMGKKLIEHTLPEIARQLERIADSLDKDNKHKYANLSTTMAVFIDGHPDDKELGKQIRQLYGK
jgi:hypothetical protein